MKVKKVKQNLSARWEIMETAKIVENEYADKPIDDAFFNRVYQGDFVKKYRAGYAEARQIWSVSILTVAKDAEGVLHNNELEFNFNEKMTIREVLSGSERLNFNGGEWQGVTKTWLESVDIDLCGMDCIEAWAEAKCTAMAKVIPTASLLFYQNLNKMVA